MEKEVLKPKEKGVTIKAAPGWIWIAVAISVIVIIIVANLIVSKKSYSYVVDVSGNKKKIEQNARKSIQNSQNSSYTENESKIEKKIKVVYDSEYGNIVYLPSGHDYYFEEATEPYCYKNANGRENCGGIGEDATGTFGNSPSNKSLRFKSQNNKIGELYICLIRQSN